MESQQAYGACARVPAQRQLLCPTGHPSAGAAVAPHCGATQTNITAVIRKIEECVNFSKIHEAARTGGLQPQYRGGTLDWTRACVGTYDGQVPTRQRACG